MSTAHANSPADLLRRVETMALMSGVSLPVDHVREQIASTIHLVVHLARFANGRRSVAQVVAVEGLRAGNVVLREVFGFTQGTPRGPDPVPRQVPGPAAPRELIGDPS